MHVLLINGSPKKRRSNTYRLSAAFLDGLGEKEHVNLRERCTAELDIKPCLGCFGCWEKTPGKCCIQDQASVILEDMLWADVIIWSFPLYYFSVPGPLKNLIDRQLPLSLPFMSRDSGSGGHPSRYDMSEKRHVVISTCGFYTAEGNYDGVDALFSHMCGKGEYTAIYCGQGELFRVKELSQRTDEYLAWMKSAGTEFACGGISQQTREKLKTKLYPREVFEAMADASWALEENGEPSDESLVFTRQMAALYNKSAWSGKDLVLEMNYTDIGKRYQILLQKDGSKVLSENFLTATTVIETSYALWQSIAAGEVSGEQALMEQKYRVTGDFNLMIHWDAFFGTQQETEPKQEPRKPTTMLLLLLPWMLFWIGMPINPHFSAIFTLCICSSVGVVFRNKRFTGYDHASSILVSILCAASLLGADPEILLPLSYLSFGWLWTVGGVQKIPMTAHYSLNDYGGENMLSNPLFLKTNRILTLCWGVMYLLISAVSFIMIWREYTWISTVISFAPAVMGVFTLWFQRWYPAHVARGR